jgi:CheY-like chemotaxis protein
MTKINKKILIVEDDPNFVAILKQKFTEDGFSVLTVQDGKEAVILADKEKPDLIISDILLPSLNGIEMAKKIKSKNIELPIIFLTNVKDPAYLDAMKEFKKVECLIKSDVRLDDIVERAKKKLSIE